MTKEQILDGIAELSVIQLSELLKEFEERFGVTAAAPVAVAVAAAPAGGGDGGGDEEKVEFDVILTEAGDKKIQVIKEVRALTSLPSLSSRRPTRTTPRRQRLPSRQLEPPSRSSSPLPLARRQTPGWGGDP
jgi:large subunit ribosomal protein L7/L12